MRGRRGQAILGGVALVVAALAGCTGSDAGDGAATTTLPLQGSLRLDAADVADVERCDPIAAGCLLPFPNDYYTVADDATATGRRVALDPESLPANVDGVHIDPTHWNELDESTRNAVLHGSGDEVIAFTYLTDAGGRTQRKHRFEGILPNLERRYRETESPAVRDCECCSLRLELL